MKVKDLISQLEKLDENKLVFIEFNGSVNFNEIEVETKKIPPIITFENGDDNIVVIKPKV